MIPNESIILDEQIILSTIDIYPNSHEYEFHVFLSYFHIIPPNSTIVYYFILILKLISKLYYIIFIHDILLPFLSMLMIPFESLQFIYLSIQINIIIHLSINSIPRSIILYSPILIDLFVIIPLNPIFPSYVYLVKSFEFCQSIFDISINHHLFILIYVTIPTLIIHI